MDEGAASPSLGEAYGARATTGTSPKAALVAAVAEAIRRRSLPQTEAARLCRTDQPTLSKVLRGRHDLVSLDKLLGWLAALGVGVEIRLDPDGPAGGVAVRDGAAEATPLHEAEERFRALAAATGEGVAIHDGERVVEANDALCAMYGYEREEVIGRDPRDFLAPGMAARSEALAASGCGEPYETLGRRKDGSTFPVELCGKSITYRGRPVRVVTARDLTAQRAAEAALREGEERLRLAQEAAGIGTWDWDLVTGTIRWSPEMYRVLGLHPERDAADPYAAWLRVLHPDDRERADAEARGRLLNTGEPFAGEFRVVRPDGEVRWIMVRGRALAGPDGRPTRVVGVNIDVTERRRAEEALRRSEELRRLALEAAGLGVLDGGGPDGSLLVDERFRELYGLAPDEVPTPEAIWARVHPGDAPRVRAALARAKEPGSDGAYEAEYRVLLPGGAERWHLARGRFGFDEAARPARFVGVVMDVTARKSTDAALRESEGRYRALTEMSPDAVYVHRDGVIILANRRAAALFGARDPDEIVGRQVFSLVDPESRELARARTARLRRPGDYNESVRLVFRRLDESRFVVEASSAAVLLDGRPAVQAVLRDVTARDAAEAALRRSEELRRLALDAGELGLWDLDYDTSALEVDGRFRELMGFGPDEEVTNPACWARVHPDDRPAVEAAVAWAKDPVSGGAYEAEYRVLLPGRGERWHLSRAQVRFAGEGEARRAVRFVGVTMDVTERRRAEEALAESETRFRAVLTGSPVFVYDMGPDLRYRWVCNPPPPLPPEDWVGRRDDETAPPEHAGPRMALKRSVIESGQAARAEVTHDRGGGDVRTYDLSLEPVRDATGRVIGLRGAAVDITERKAAEAARAASEERLRLAIEATGLGIFDVDPVAGTRRWSDEYKAILGLPPDARPDPELYVALIHPEDRAWVRERYRGACRGENGGRFGAEYRILRADDGTERWVHNTGMIRFDADGRAVRAVGTLLDITERKRAEAAMRESEARYRTVFEQAAVGIKQVALTDGRLLAANDAMCRMLGYTSDELVGLRVTDIIHPDDLPAERAQLDRLLAGEIASYAIEKRYLKKGGEPVWVRATTSIPRTAGARERYRISVVEDVTARKRAEEHQRLLLGELSHRVKNMLAVVRGIALHSLGGGRTIGEAREVLEQRLAALATAHGLLTAGDWRGAGLRDLVAAELAPYEGRVTLGGPEVMLPPNAALSLALALHELATNALKYGALSVPEGRVELRWSCPGGRLRLAWREEGGPTVAPPARRGFGSLLIERSVAHNLGGAARLEFRPEGLAYEVELPLEPG